MADPWMEWMERMEKQISNIQTMVQGAKILLDKNSKEVTEINRNLFKEETNSEENSTARTSDKSHHGNLNSMPSLDFQPTEDINNLVKLLDPFHHIEVSPPCAVVPIHAQPHHYSKIAPSPPTIESQHKAIYKLATHRLTNPSLIEKIHQPDLLQKLYLVIHGATTISNPHKTIKENRRVQIWTLGNKVAFPLSKRPPRKRMKGQR
jgi:hypothetical protein